MLQENFLKIVLFDIDGTLINSVGIGKKAMNEAFLSVVGIENALKNISLYGSTDTAIFKSLSKEYPFVIENQNRIKQKYFELLKKYLSENSDKTILPGVLKLLTNLKNKNFKLGIVTGNFKESAYLKLNSLNLDKYFTFWGCAITEPERSLILKSVLQKISKPYKAILVGDTPYDANAAYLNHISSVCVLTGIHTVSDLLNAKSSIVIENLEYLNEELINVLF